MDWWIDGLLDWTNGGRRLSEFGARMREKVRVVTAVTGFVDLYRVKYEINGNPLVKMGGMVQVSLSFGWAGVQHGRRRVYLGTDVGANATNQVHLHVAVVSGLGVAGAGG